MRTGELSARGGCLAKLLSSLESTAGVLAFSVAIELAVDLLFLSGDKLLESWLGTWWLIACVTGAGRFNGLALESAGGATIFLTTSVVGLSSLTALAGKGLLAAALFFEVATEFTPNKLIRSLMS